MSSKPRCTVNLGVPTHGSLIAVKEFCPMNAIRGSATTQNHNRIISLSKLARRRTATLASIAILTLLFAIPFSAKAQVYDHTDFVHGFASDSSIWLNQYRDLNATPIQYLSGLVQLKMWATPELYDTASYTSQAARLGNRLISAGGLHIVVGHSLGSLVSRGAYLDNASTRPRYKGIVAITPPFQGSILADSAIKMRNYMADLTRRMSDAQGAVMIISDVFTFALGYALGGWL